MDLFHPLELQTQFRDVIHAGCTLADVLKRVFILKRRILTTSSARASLPGQPTL
jgi:hypothetical protein